MNLPGDSSIYFSASFHRETLIFWTVRVRATTTRRFVHQGEWQGSRRCLLSCSNVISIPHKYKIRGKFQHPEATLWSAEPGYGVQQHWPRCFYLTPMFCCQKSAFYTSIGINETLYRGCGFAFSAGCCFCFCFFLQKLCSRFYTKLVCCYETDPLSLVHSAFRLQSSSLKLQLVSKQMGMGGSALLTSGLRAAHHPLWKRPKSRRAFLPVCVF